MAKKPQKTDTPDGAATGAATETFPDSPKGQSEVTPESESTANSVTTSELRAAIRARLVSEKRAAGLPLALAEECADRQLDEDEARASGRL